MKKVISCFLAVVMILSFMTLSVSAADSHNADETQVIKDVDGSTIVCFEDGSFLSISPVNVTKSSTATLATTKTVTGDRVAKFTNANGVVEWKYTLTASFSYVSGTSSKCTSASYTEEIYNNDWKFSDGSATKSGNVAYGKGKFVCKIFFVTVRTYNIDISITCDTYGNLS